MKRNLLKRQSGAVAAEYIIGLIFLVIVLLVPIPTFEGRNIMQVLGDAIKQEHSGYIKASGIPSLPVPDNDSSED